MDAITSSLSATLEIDLASAVNIFNSSSFVQATLAYEGVSAVSEPASIALLGLSMLGLGVARRRKAA